MKTSKTQLTGKQKKSSATTEAVSSKKITISNSGPDEEEIRAKAKEIYNERMARGEHGTSEGDWIKAEELLKGSKK